MRKLDTVKFNAFVSELRTLEKRHGITINAGEYELYAFDDERPQDIENRIWLPPVPIPGDVPYEVVAAVFNDRVRHGELPEHWLETVLRTHWREGTRAIYREDFPHRAAIIKMMEQVACTDRDFRLFTTRASCEGPEQWAEFLTLCSPWYSAAEFKPAHVGLYEVAFDNRLGGFYSYWNGSHWLAISADRACASHAASISDAMYHKDVAFRGLRVKP